MLCCSNVEYLSRFDKMNRLTVLNCPPLRCWATDLATDGFSATQRILRAMCASQPNPKPIYLLIGFHNDRVVSLHHIYHQNRVVHRVERARSRRDARLVPVLDLKPYL